MRIGNIDLSDRVMIIAEIGNNHEGNFDTAADMIRQAAAAGADAVKLQTYVGDGFVSPLDHSRYRQLQEFRLSTEAHVQLAALAESEGILFLSTPLDIDSVDRLNELVVAYKIASGDVTFYPLIEAIAATGKPIIFSSGATTLSELRHTQWLIGHIWHEHQCMNELCVLHCVSAYPAAKEQSGLAAIEFLHKELGCTIGYSDHTLGIDAAALSVAAGARIVEKHFTLDATRQGFRDHQLSANPTEFRRLVDRIRDCERLLGRADKVVQPCEANAPRDLRRSIVARRDLRPGDAITMSDLTWMRPATGLAPGCESRILGRRLVRGVQRGEMLLETMFRHDQATFENRESKHRPRLART